VTNAYPYYIDVHNPFFDSTLVCESVPVERVIGTHEEMVEQVIGLDTVWTLVTVVDKITVDSSFNCRREPILDFEGNPSITQRIIPIDEAVCNIVASYSDTEFNTCGLTRKIYRDWSLIDWCNSGIVRNERQVIEITDNVAPTVSFISDRFVSVEPWTCSARVQLPFVFVQDACSSTLEREFSSVEGTIEEGFITDLWIDQSPVTVNFKATDECGNVVEDDFMIVIRDDVNPLAICDVDLQVNLTMGFEDPEAVAKIYAESLDEGSHDAGCGPVSFKVVRMDDWTEEVYDCNGEFLGYKAVSCHALSSPMDVGELEFKTERCGFEGTNMVDIRKYKSMYGSSGCDQ